MHRPPDITLPATSVNAPAPEWMTPITTTSRPRGSGMFGNGTNRQLQQVETSVRTQGITRTVRQEFETKSQALPTNLEAEISSHRSQYPNSSLSAVQAWQREVDIREALRTRKTAELAQRTTIANAFFGSDPRDKSFADFVRKATTIDTLIWPGARSTQLWEQSFLAAHEAQLLRQSIALLQQQSATAHVYLRAAQNQEQAARVAAEQARVAAEQAQQLAAQRSRIAAEQAARRKRQRLARLKARADAEVQAEHARLKADWKKQTEARWKNPVFAHVGSAAVSGSTFSGTLGEIAIDQATTLALNGALRRGVASAVAAASAFAAPAVVGFAALLVPSELGNGDLFSASVPLSNVASDLTDDLYELAAVGGRAHLPVRLGTRTVGNRVEIVIVSTDGVTVPSDVPVRLADFDPEKNVYVATAGSNGPTVTWTPLIEPIDPSSALPQVDRQLPVYDGATVKSADGRIDPFPELDLYEFGGYITLFPIESGIPPILTVFRDRRQDPGVASGLGQPVSGNWLGTASTSKGAPIPAQIADKLRGKEFSNFRAFRRAFWKAVGNDPALLEQFSRLNKIDLRDGLAPSALPSEQIGKRKKFEIHHHKPISEGGDVYDINNLTVLTPKQHIELHLKKGKL